MAYRPRRLSTGGIALALAWVVSVTSACVANASLRNWEGTLAVEVLGFPPLAVVGGGVATLDGPGGAMALETLRIATSRGVVAGSAMFPITDPVVQANGIASLRASVSLGAGSFAPISGAASWAPLTRGEVPVRGLVKICLLSTLCSNFHPLLLTQATASGPGAGVKGVGIGGLVVVGGPLQFSIEGAPWTLRTATVSVATAGGARVPVVTSGFVHGAASLTGTTGLPGGALQLVTPIQVRSNQGAEFAGFGRLGVRFLPEPGVALLLAAGCLGLGVLQLHGPRRKE